MMACTSPSYPFDVYIDCITNRHVLILYVPLRVQDTQLTRPTDGIAASATISLINYIMLGFQFPTDDFYMHSFEIWLATFVVFFGAGNVGYVLLRYRLGEKGIVGGAIECFGWIPFLWVLLCFLQYGTKS
jgi:hypothetical protein